MACTDLFCFCTCHYAILGKPALRVLRCVLFSDGLKAFCIERNHYYRKQMYYFSIRCMIVCLVLPGGFFVSLCLTWWVYVFSPAWSFRFRERTELEKHSCICFSKKYLLYLFVLSDFSVFMCEFLLLLLIVLVLIFSLQIHKVWIWYRSPSLTGSSSVLECYCLGETTDEGTSV